MIDNKNKYKFNRTGLVLAGINRHSNATNKFYCSGFVKYILDKSDIDVSALPKITHPEDFELLEGLTNIYIGYLRNYNYIEQQEIEI
ncbi:MAG: hypothetical protein PHT75_02210 [Bacilli bacterium]|nr:hypothetical protein [Bacilli bacterium]MDD3304925.1 hypothetical protein [Bacilli bacterium]MDD4053746.1 hypothetical protein [Bacilli bacterium]MDD4411594.1 hypothetical protein [Bacilli bacterium]